MGRRKNKGGENFRENGSDTEGKSVTQGGKRQNRERKVTAPARGRGKGKRGQKVKVSGGFLTWRGMGMDRLLPLLVTTLSFLAKVSSGTI